MSESLIQQQSVSSSWLSRMDPWTAGTILFTIAVAIFATIATGPFTLVNSIVTGGMWALMAAGLSLVFGVMNIVQFAHGEMFMIGTLVAYYVFTPITGYLKENPSDVLAFLAPLPGIIAALLVGAVVGAVMEILVFAPLRRRTQEQWIMNTFLLTVGISVIVINGVQLIFGTDFKGITRYWDMKPVDVVGVIVPIDRLMAFVLAMITMVVFWFFMRRTRTGRAIRAVSQDETGSLMVGIDLNRIQILTLSLSTALASMAGASLLFLFPSYPTVGLKPLYIAWYVVILAGLGNVAGALVGGFIVGLLSTLTSYFVGVGWEDVIPTAVVMIILLIKPSGLFGSEVKGIHEQ